MSYLFAQYFEYLYKIKSIDELVVVTCEYKIKGVMHRLLEVNRLYLGLACISV